MTLSALLAFPSLHSLRSVESGSDHLGTAVMTGHVRLLPFCGHEPIILVRLVGGSYPLTDCPTVSRKLAVGRYLVFGGGDGTPTRDQSFSKRLLYAPELRPRCITSLSPSCL